MEGRRVNHSAPKRNPLYVMFLCLVAAVFVLLIVVIVLGAKLGAAQKAAKGDETQIGAQQEQVKELEDEGIEVMDQTLLIKPLLPPPGVLTKRKPTEAELADMEFGFEMAKAIGGLDIGQTVVVKNRAVMAVEAIEGTDACILRGGFLGKGGVIVAKAAKPKQDQRFDIPGFGTTTIESMIHAGATGAVIEAGNTIIPEREKVIALADEHNITILVK